MLLGERGQRQLGFDISVIQVKFYDGQVKRALMWAESTSALVVGVTHRVTKTHLYLYMCNELLIYAFNLHFLLRLKR